MIHSAYYLLPTTYCLLLTIHYLHPLPTTQLTTDYSLLTTYCLRPTKYFQVYGDFSRYHQQFVFARRSVPLPFPFDDTLCRVQLQFTDNAVQRAMQAIAVEGWSVWDALPGFAKCKDLSDFFDQYDASPNISFLGPGACGHDDWMVRDVTPPLFSKDLPADQFFVVSIGNATLWGRKRHVRIFDANKKLLHSSYEGGWLAKVWGTHTTKQD